ASAPPAQDRSPPAHGHDSGGAADLSIFAADLFAIGLFTTDLHATDLHATNLRLDHNRHLSACPNRQARCGQTASRSEESGAGRAIPSGSGDRGFEQQPVAVLPGLTLAPQAG